MDGDRFDTLARSFHEAPSRRGLLRGLAGAALGLAALRLPGVASAKKRRKKKKKKQRSAKKPRANSYGCLNVGQACGGNDALCCSGICEGNKPKQGKNDTSRCVGHNAGICAASFDLCTTGGAHFCDAGNTQCACMLTTGNAGFCGDLTGGVDTLCRDCTKDAECQEEFGQEAACLTLGGICTTICADTGGTACAPTCAKGPCVADCTGKTCGDDGCGGSCGSCTLPETCGAGTCCVPDCNGKDCGDSGCGGSCGPCTGGTCQDGICDCPEEKCDGECVAPCSSGNLRNPFTCDCCHANGILFGASGSHPGCNNGRSDRCCSGVCRHVPSIDMDECIAKAAGEGCSFGAQCASGICQDTGLGAGTCA